MRAALVLSREALPECRPNPPVGCVIADTTGVVSQGFTGAPGQRHAEAAAIAGVARSANPSSLAAFVTLEPCAFRGRTPSCAQALVELGIGQVFVGIVDPDPRNNGKGLHMLRQAGVSVEVGILQEEVEQFLAPYLARPS